MSEAKKTKRTIAVTGGHGKLGRAVVDELLAHDYDPYVVDRASVPNARCRTFVADLTDYGEVTDALAGHKDERPHAVVHLAANPLPWGVPAPRTFHNNASGDFHVFEACRRLGIKRVVWASSVMVFGVPFEANAPPASLPLDESASPRPGWTYSLVKLLGETMAERYCRQDPSTTIVGLRLGSIMSGDDYAKASKIDANPAGASGYLWQWVDARDAAQAVRLSIEATLSGAHVFTILAADTCSSRPSAELVDEFFPDVPRTRALEGNETVISIDNARRALGYAPQHSWRDMLATHEKGEAK